MSTIGEAGEFALIERLVARLPQGPSVALGPGDDAAVIAAPDGRVVATSDLLVEGRHFRRDWSGPYDIGRKAAAQNLADVAAMGARPTALLLGLAAPPDTPLDWALRLADGLREECALVGASVAGGDVVRAPQITLAVTALGDLGGGPPLTRSGARPGDVVAVRGRLGYASAGLALLSEGRDGPAGLLDAHRRPRPPYEAGPQARELGATALIDVSDGLVQDLGHIADAAGVLIELDSAALPVPAELGPGGLHHVLTGGDDHAFAGTFPPDAPLPGSWTVIGRVAAGPAGVVVDGRPLQAGGWDHFRS
ncbi:MULTISPECIES: thiamine-phosphate kinase [Thermomonospora]|uniref:Thiamine-monophosphate kinase n=1 Tax=Thermomonospora cellulosilytica TaxID=1411118 RepID=A0A7W3N3Z9_9ACTN|nr:MULTISPECIES: thiamine-phosphate kinase [Thermomonospora]MBA9007134.1 thiamine-monophosphate kinase [Thermomonospora cellulosilytica]